MSIAVLLPASMGVRRAIDNAKRQLQTFGVACRFGSQATKLACPAPAIPLQHQVQNQQSIAGTWRAKIIRLTRSLLMMPQIFMQ
jgi:hypothetical protein